MKKFKDFVYGLFIMDNQPSSRLLFGSIGFVTCLVLIILTVAFGFNGKPEHIEIMKHLLYVTAALLGLSALDLSNLKSDNNNKKDNR